MWRVQNKFGKSKIGKKRGSDITMIIGLFIMSVLEPGKRVAIEEVQKRKELPSEEETIDGQ